MAQGCCQKQSLKRMIFLTNAFILIFGLAVLGVGVYFNQFQAFDVDIIGSNHVYYCGIGLMVAGGILAVFSMIGCCSVICEALFLIRIYIVLKFFLFIAFLSAGILLFCYQDTVLLATKKHTTDTFKDNYGYDQPLTEAWNNLQRTQKCCAVSASSDYQSTKFFNLKGNQKLPQACCRMNVTTQDYVSIKSCEKEPLTMTESDFIYTEGCLSKLLPHIKKGINVTAILLLCVAFICLVGFAFGIRLSVTTFRNPTYV